MRLRIAENFRAVFYAPFYAIRALGFAQREGLDVEWVSSATPGGAIEQVKRGAIDAQWGGPMRVLKDNAASLVCFAEVVCRDPFYLVGSRPGSFRLEDLARMRLAAVSEVPTPWLCLRADLEDAGVDVAALRPRTDLTMAQQLAALREGELDAAQVFEPYATQALADGRAHVLYAAAARGPCSYTAFICSRAGATAKREEFAALTRATQAMLDWLGKEGPAALARVAAPFFADVPEKTLRAALERYHRAGIWSSATQLSHAGFERLADSLQRGGFVARAASYDECVRDFGRPS